MEEKTINANDEIQIDLQRLLGALVSRAWIISIVAIVCAVLAFVGTFFLITPMYQSSAMFYVNNSAVSFGDAALSISSADISASRGLVKTYIVILNTRESINDVIDYAGVDRTYSEVKEMISAASVDSTEVFRVVVESPDPQEAEKIADAIAYILPKRISSIVEGTSAKIVDSAVVASRPSSPNYTRNAVIGFLAGLVLSMAFIVVRELMDITIRTEEDITQNVKHPILAAVPDMQAQGKGGYYGYGYGKKKGYSGRSYGYDYGYARRRSYDRSASGENRPVEMIGGGISFMAAEAYKLLRTKLQFSFADEGNSRVIGVSSALTGEGKSLTAVNLAYTLSQLEKNVLLIDCDMRRPSLADKLPIDKSPGLSDFLSGQIGIDELVQVCGLLGEEDAFYTVASGRNPPNPMELLSSVRMEKLLGSLREVYDYVILDLPPVSEVSDALAVSKYTDGMLLVVRQNYCDRIALGSAVHQFEFVDARILGVVFNGTSESGTGYGSRYYNKYYRRYKQYYKKYYKAYSGRHASEGAAQRDDEKNS